MGQIEPIRSGFAERHDVLEAGTLEGDISQVGRRSAVALVVDAHDAQPHASLEWRAYPRQVDRTFDAQADERPADAGIDGKTSGCVGLDATRAWARLAGFGLAAFDKSPMTPFRLVGKVTPKSIAPSRPYEAVTSPMMMTGSGPMGNVVSMRVVVSVWAGTVSGMLNAVASFSIWPALRAVRMEARRLPVTFASSVAALAILSTCPLPSSLW